MEENHRNRLRKGLPFLLENLKVLTPLDLIYSSQEKVLSDEDYEKILAKTTESDKIRLTVLILLRSGPKAFDAFIHSLKSSGQAFIAEELLKEPGNEQFIDLEDSDSKLVRTKSNGTGSLCNRRENEADSTVQTSTLTGYIHQVQKKCKSKKGNWFSSFMVQTDEKTYQRCITFYPDLHKDTLERYAQDQMSVCLKGGSCLLPNRIKKSKKNAMMIDSCTEFENAAVAFAFMPQPCIPLSGITKFCLGQFILIKVEIIKEGELTKIVKKGRKLDMRVKHVRDENGFEMELAAWQEFSRILIVGKWYVLSNVSIKLFNGSCKLSTNIDTSAKEVKF